VPIDPGTTFPLPKRVSDFMKKSSVFTVKGYPFVEKMPIFAKKGCSFTENGRLNWEFVCPKSVIRTYEFGKRAVNFLIISDFIYPERKHIRTP
jgi:hypothetical protein